MKNTSGWSAYYAIGARTPEQVLVNPQEARTKEFLSKVL